MECASSSRGIQTGGIGGERRCRAEEAWQDLSDGTHEAVTTARTRRDVDAGEFEHKCTRCFQAWFSGWDVHEQCSDLCKALLLGAVGKEPEGADAHEALGQHMKGENAG